MCPCRRKGVGHLDGTTDRRSPDLTRACSSRDGTEPPKHHRRRHQDTCNEPSHGCRSFIRCNSDVRPSASINRPGRQRTTVSTSRPMQSMHGDSPDVSVAAVPESTGSSARRTTLGGCAGATFRRARFRPACSAKNMRESVRPGSCGLSYDMTSMCCTRRRIYVVCWMVEAHGLVRVAKMGVSAVRRGQPRKTDVVLGAADGRRCVRCFSRSSISHAPHRPGSRSK